MYFLFRNKLYRLYRLIITQFIYTKYFKSIGKQSVVFKSMKIINPINIEIGDNVTIEDNVTLYAITRYSNNTYKGKISIGNDVYINYNCNITAANEIIIEDNVVIAFNVSLFDFNHNYENVDIPVKYSDLHILGSIKIRKNCWIGMNVAIIGNVTLEEGCVVGANSVVTKSFPKYTVLIGSPARAIKRYDFVEKKWRETNEKGEFINEI